MRFIGCKENLLPFIDNFITKKNISGNIFCDLLSGTTSVAKYFKKRDYKIISNDFLYFSYVFQKAYIETNYYPSFRKLLDYLGIKSDSNTLFSDERTNLENVIQYLNNLEGKEGFIYNNYSYEGTKDKKFTRRYFTGENAKRIDAIRETIETWYKQGLLDENEYFLLVAAVVEAVPFVSNISGTYGAFLKTWDPRAFKKFILQVPEIISSNQKHQVFNKDFSEIINKIDCDILYVDPPYNERQYAPNYHILETIARWDNPSISGKTGLRPYEKQKSKFCTKEGAAEALREIISKAKFKHFLLSYNNEGILSKEEIQEVLNDYGKVEVLDQDYQRFKSNSNGEKANTARTKELLFYLKAIHPQNTLNDLSGSEWLYFLNSVEVTSYSTNGQNGYAHDIRKIHPSPKPPQLMQKIIEFFTKEGGLVFDPFVGVGGTLLGCSLCGRKGIGIDLSQKYLDACKRAAKSLGLQEQITIQGDSRQVDKLLAQYPDLTIDLILTDPPYSEMLSRKRTGQRKKEGNGEATPFTDSELDLGNLDYDSFFDALKEIIEKCLRYLKPKGYLALFCKDLQPTKNHPNLLHAEVVNKLNEIKNLRFRGYKIWYDKTQNLYPFGYPHAFVANQFHQYILIFRKEK